MTREEEIQIKLKEAEINYSTVWRISNEVFTKKSKQGFKYAN